MITLDASADSGVKSNINDTSWSHTVGTAGSNTALFVITSIRDIAGGHSVTGVTYGGVAMTKAVDATDSERSISIWYLASPATGENTVAVDVTDGTDDFVGTSLSYYGMDLNDLVEATNTASASGDPACAVTVANNQTLVLSALISYLTSDLTCGQTIEYQGTLAVRGGRGAGSSLVTTSTGSINMTWTGSAVYSIAVAAFNGKSNKPKVMFIG